MLVLTPNRPLTESESDNCCSTRFAEPRALCFFECFNNCLVHGNFFFYIPIISAADKDCKLPYTTQLSKHSKKPKAKGSAKRMEQQLSDSN